MNINQKKLMFLRHFIVNSKVTKEMHGLLPRQPFQPVQQEHTRLCLRALWEVVSKVMLPLTTIVSHQEDAQHKVDLITRIILY